ncbi:MULTISPECIES: Fe-S cluster assembly protein IscX [unclassified Cupriavidus]|uniref:Fe-S cluster assembly protein IscX n=1 Tax=unclassified Cupriavidus TaxID=2640874 RepID=UPI000888ABF9|nr:Fe-S cluster assembly protein IscX [Cupriavidus sp. YR651]SDD23623.1 FeS assembly protein IscX [Cupriavidus sp. YR651]
MKWTDTYDIAAALYDKYPDVDPVTVRFTQLRQWVLELDDFSDMPERSGEKILEAIQAAWIEEAQ